MSPSPRPFARRSVALLALLALPAACSDSFDPEDEDEPGIASGVVEGTIQGPSSEPVEGAQIEVSANDGSISATGEGPVLSGPTAACATPWSRACSSGRDSSSRP